MTRTNNKANDIKLHFNVGKRIVGELFLRYFQLSYRGRISTPNLEEVLGKI